MVNIQIAGIILILICAAGLAFAWVYQKKGQYAKAIALLVFVGFIIRLFTSCDFYLHTWDERYHALVAKNLIHHPFLPTLYDNPLLDFDFKDWTRNHVWLHKQPFTLVSIALSLKFFGCNEIALRLPSVILSSIAIILVFEIGKFYFSKKAAFIAALLFSINGLIIELCSGRVPTDHVDSFFLFFILLSIYFVMKFTLTQSNIYNILAGVMMGVAILCKWLSAFIVIPIWVFLVADSRKFTMKNAGLYFSYFLLISLIIFLPWQIYIHYAYPLENAWEMAYNTRHLFESIENHSASYFYFINKIRINYGELIYLPLIYFIYSVIKQRTDFKKWSLFIWIFVPLIFFSFAQTKMQGYIAFISPALFMITGDFVCWLESLPINEKPKLILRKALVYSFYLLAIRYCFERVKPLEGEKRQPITVEQLKKLNGVYSKAVLFNYDDPISAMFYTNLVAYSELPEDTTLERLQLLGYKILINDTSLTYHSQLEEISYVKLFSLKR